MRDSKPARHITESEEDEAMESENESNLDESQDLFELLKTDHRHVEELFSRFENADKRTKIGIAEEALTQLEVHAAIEEELVYPAIREAIDDQNMVDEAKEEHHVVKLLIKELRKMDAGEEEFAPKFKVVGDIVRHHVEEEEQEMFPQAEQAGLDQAELSEQVMKRKEKLMQKHERSGKKSTSRRKAA
jgi:Hemerythrin HHE cation binding domain